MGLGDPLVGRGGSMCEEVIVCIAVAVAENDSLVVAADKLRVAARVANDTNISLFIGLFFRPFLIKTGRLSSLEVR
jgi:hypothetical protein